MYYDECLNSECDTTMTLAQITTLHVMVDIFKYVVFKHRTHLFFCNCRGCCWANFSFSKTSNLAIIILIHHIYI